MSIPTRDIEEYQLWNILDLSSVRTYPWLSTSFVDNCGARTSVVAVGALIWLWKRGRQIQISPGNTELRSNDAHNYIPPSWLVWPKRTNQSQLKSHFTIQGEPKPNWRKLQRVLQNCYIISWKILTVNGSKIRSIHS